MAAVALLDSYTNYDAIFDVVLAFVVATTTPGSLGTAIKKIMAVR